MAIEQRRSDAAPRGPVRGSSRRSRGNDTDPLARPTRLRALGLAPSWTAFLDRRRDAASVTEAATPTSEIADCSCPAFCERDHENE